MVEIADIPLEAFVKTVPVGMFTDEEIAEWIRTRHMSAQDEIVLARAVSEFKLGGPITGVIRTALREKKGPPPVPGDVARDEDRGTSACTRAINPG